MTRVAVALIRCKDLGALPIATLVLPTVEPTGHRYNSGVTKLREGLGGEGRPHATCAHDDQRRVLVRDSRLDLGLEVATWNEHRAGHCALFELVSLTNVEKCHSAVAQGFCLSGVNLVDFGLRLIEEVSEAAHGPFDFRDSVAVFLVVSR